MRVSHRNTEADHADRQLSLDVHWRPTVRLVGWLRSVRSHPFRATPMTWPHLMCLWSAECDHELLGADVDVVSLFHLLSRSSVMTPVTRLSRLASQHSGESARRPHRSRGASTRHEAATTTRRAGAYALRGSLAYRGPVRCSCTRGNAAYQVNERHLVAARLDPACRRPTYWLTDWPTGSVHATSSRTDNRGLCDGESSGRRRGRSGGIPAMAAEPSVEYTARDRSLDPVRWPPRLISCDRRLGDEIAADSLAPHVSSRYTDVAAIRFIVVRARSHAVKERKKIRHMPTCQQRGVFGTRETRRINRWTLRALLSDG